MTAFIRHNRRAAVTLVAMGILLLNHSPGFGQPAPVPATSIQFSTPGELPPNLPLEIAAQLQAQGGMPPSAATAGPATNAAPASPEQERLQALLKLKFERTPTAILKAFQERNQSKESNTNEVEVFQAHVVLGDWDAVGEFLKKLPDDHGQQVYRHLIRDLPNSAQPGRAAQQPGQPPRPNNGPQLPTTPTLVIGDVTELIRIAPAELEKADLSGIGRLLSSVLSRGDTIEPLIEQLEAGIGNVGGSDPANRKRAAELLVSAGRVNESVEFLPELESVKAEEDFDTLDLMARQFMTRGQRESSSDDLRQAWGLNQFILASENATSTNREPALKRVFELIPLVSDELGSDWLRQSFSKDPNEGIAILSAVSKQVQDATSSRNVNTRQKALELQKDVVEVFLEVADQDQAHWKPTLQLMAVNWFQEGTYAKQRYQPPRQQYGPMYDPYGNIIGYNNPPPNMNRGNQLQPISTTAIIDSAPGESWIAQLDAAFQPTLLLLIADLHLKSNKLEEALSLIKTLAREHADKASELANNYLQFWASSKNPAQGPNNISSRYYGPSGQIYYTSSPYGNRRQGIALTRAKQQRNLRELADLLNEFRELSITNLNDQQIISAFTSSHSQAEVFRKEDIENVFGRASEMELESLNSIVSSMRQRLAGQWRQPQVQQRAQTKRKDPDIEKEVLRGYETVIELIDEGLSRDAENWSLYVVRGAAFFDLAEFQYGKKVDLEIYVEKRDEAFDTFEKAAVLYAANLENIEEKKQSPHVYQQWFNANLGASDLAYVTRQTEPAVAQLEKIRAAILSLPGDAAERHMKGFAEGIANTALNLKPELKPRYLRASLSIVGDHEAAEPAREMVRYYDDLLNEVEFVVQIDGDTTVGHAQPFGLLVSLRHTADIEREAGGFARYLQTKRNPYTYSPMPMQQRQFTDEFSDQVREKLVDQFDVKVITFLDEKVQSRGYGRPGWRETPMAYILVQAKDPSADRIPPLHMDLDFMDQRGTVVLPVESTMTLIDARPEQVAPRPLQNIEITQVLDERELAEGLLTLEIKATALGIIPELDGLLETNLAGFSIEEFSDNGMTVTHIDTENDDVLPAGERNWLIKLRVPEDAPQSLAFKFPEPRSDETNVIFKRYEDADLAVVESEVALAGIPLHQTPLWQWILMGVIAVAAILGVRLVAQNRDSGEELERSLYELPDPVTPFGVIGLLREMRSDSRLKWNINQQQELDQTITQLESHYFSQQRNGDPDPDLNGIGKRWVGSLPKTG